MCCGDYRSGTTNLQTRESYCSVLVGWRPGLRLKNADAGELAETRRTANTEFFTREASLRVTPLRFQARCSANMVREMGFSTT